MKRFSPAFVCGALSLLAFGFGCQQSTTTGSKTGNPNASGAKRLTLMAAKDQTIKRGDTDKVLVTINRDNFNEPVTIKVNGLPKGVMIDGTKDPVIASGDNTTTLTLKAAPDAVVGEHSVTISAEAKDMTKNDQTFRLTVRE